MSQEQLNAILSEISADIVRTISSECEISENEAIKVLYSSKVYEMLEDETTKLWQYSTPMIYSLLEQEMKTGTICFPDV
jgi:hypothetical protein